MAHILDGGQFQVNPSLVTTDENAFALGALSGRNAGIITVQADTSASENNGGVERSQRSTLGSIRSVLTEGLLCLAFGSTSEIWFITEKNLPVGRAERT